MDTCIIGSEECLITSIIDVEAGAYIVASSGKSKKSANESIAADLAGYVSIAVRLPL